MTMEPRSLLNALEAWTQEEIAGSRRLLGLLQEQEQAVRATDGDGLEQAVRKVEGEMERQAERGRKRERLFAALGQAWGVAPGTLTLSSICERAGPNGARLSILHDDLRQATAAVAKRNRRLSSLLEAHRRVLEDLIGALIGIQDAAPLRSRGTLIDAEA